MSKYPILVSSFTILKKVYSGDPKSDPLKSGIIPNQDFLKVRIQNPDFVQLTWENLGMLPVF